MDHPISIAARISPGWDGLGTPSLNSERIRARYGDCRIRVLDQADGVRRSALFSSTNGLETCRTQATVRFASVIPAELTAAHTAITAGASLGMALATSDLSIVRRTLGICTQELGSGLSAVTRSMRIDLPARLAVHIYQLDVAPAAGPLPYATIAEIHHPSYLDEADLHDAFTIDAAEPRRSAICDEMIALAMRQKSES